MPVPQVDPDARAGAIKRAARHMVNSPPGRWLGMTIAARVDVWLLERTGGRVYVPFMMPVGTLTAIGAKSGQPRRVPILYFTEGDDVILIASNWGRKNHPGWYHNLRRNPEFSLVAKGGEGRYVATEVADQAERDRLYAQACKIFPGYAKYEVLAGDRDIRVMRCAPAA